MRVALANLLLEIIIIRDGLLLPTWFSCDVIDDVQGGPKKAGPKTHDHNIMLSNLSRLKKSLEDSFVTLQLNAY